MNEKFFAALAFAIMTFTASGSIAVLADDFVIEIVFRILKMGQKSADRI